MSKITNKRPDLYNYILGFAVALPLTIAMWQALDNIIVGLLFGLSIGVVMTFALSDDQPKEKRKK